MCVSVCCVFLGTLKAIYLIASRIREATPFLRCCGHTQTLLIPTTAGLGVELQYHADWESSWPSVPTSNSDDVDTSEDDVTLDSLGVPVSAGVMVDAYEPSTG